MADLQLKADGKGISYPGTPNTGNAVTDSQTPGSKLYIFLNGGQDENGKLYPKVDMSLWDQATMCGTCHVGGPTYEKDRTGQRLPFKTLMDMAMGDVNPFTSTVWMDYDVNGTDKSFATTAPWIYPQYKGNNPALGPIMANPANAWVTKNQLGQSVPTGQVAMTMTEPNSGQGMPVYSGQLMMPNVKEMDCMFCHFRGYDNIMASVMTQAGSLNATPGAGAGFFDISPISPTYMGYASNNGRLTFMPYSTAQTGRVQMVSMSDSTVAKILPKPDSNNCLQCHATKTLKNLPEMFGETGTSVGFMSSSPMTFDPAHAMGPIGRRMVSFDINAMWLPKDATSPTIDYTNYMNYMMPGMPYPQAMETYQGAKSAAGILGGGNPGMTGPLLYGNTAADQRAMKRSVGTFARAEWFKRGDAWQDGQDVHGSFGCAGCHFTGDTSHKNQCDPGRGFDMASTIEDGVPHLVKRKVPTERGGGFEAYSGAQTPDKHDTRNTVKRCEFCHVTGKSYYGAPIDTFGAPDPTAKHAQYGLTANVVQINDKIATHGTSYGAQGVSAVTNFTDANTKLGKGTHLDVMDCTVCHVQKKSMAVRALDASSGMRYPSVVGTNLSKGMIGLFEDPAPDSVNAAAVDQYNGIYDTINKTFGMNIPMIPPGTHVVGGGPVFQEWKPLHMWQRLGNMEAPLSFGNGGASQMNFRRKIYLSNPITAMLWNNIDPSVDANGDTVPGGLLIGDNDEQHRTVKPSLAGYTEVFDGGAPDKNNTQGYGEPIYDPWIMHDLEAGMNFSTAPISIISIGFGPMDGTAPYASAYDQNGLCNGSWKYLSVWSGPVVFTEPNEIHSYLLHRDALEAAKPDAALRKRWTPDPTTGFLGTQLTLAGAPFMVTHGVKPTSTYVKGGKDELNADGTVKVKHGCADCHAAGAGFFNGPFTMTGTALPGDVTWNPTGVIAENAVQDVHGDFKRPSTLQEGYIAALDGRPDFMHRSLEPFRVKGYKGEVRTFFEGFNKLGQPRSPKFEESDDTYTWTVPLKRADVLYPDEDGEIYYKIADTLADGTPKADAIPMNGRAYATYMETQVTAAASGIGIDPVATINPIADIDPVSAGVQVGYTVSLSAAAAQGTYGTPPVDVGTNSYTWSFSDGTASKTGKTASVTFATAGSKTITLTVKDEEGKQVQKTAAVTVVAPGVTVSPVTNVTHNVSQLFTFSGMPTGWAKLKVTWGDGTSAIVTSPATTWPHTYTTAGSKTMQITVYNSLSQQMGSPKSVIITVN